MTALPTIDDELRQMRERIAILENALLRTRDRQPALTFPRYVRPAMTWRDIDTAYPNQTEKNTFPITFCDASFNRRSATHDVFAAWPRGYWLPRGTKVLVVEDRAAHVIVDAFFNIHRLVNLASDMVSNSTTFVLDDLDETTVTAANTGGVWDNAKTNDLAYVACIEGTWQVMDVYDCDAITGAGA